MHILQKLSNLLRKYEPNLTFNILEVGARPTGEKEPFHDFVSLFPGSKIIGFEVEKELCDELNAKTPEGFEYHPYALGDKEERRNFYVTTAPMCSSLYKPNLPLLESYNGISELVGIEEVIEVETTTLNKVLPELDIEQVDFIKIDVQGAEYDIFKGATDFLNKTLFILTEVEFIPLYEDQPLYQDIAVLLNEQGLMFHKFHSHGTRNLKPTVIMNKPEVGTQLLWSDAIFFKDLSKLDTLEPPRLLKLAMLAGTYGSIDVAIHCIRKYSEQKNVPLIKEFMALMN